MGALEIAAALATSRRAVRLYPREHPTHREAITELVTAVHGSVDIKPLSMNQRKGRLYEGSTIVAETTPATRALVEAMEVRRVESLTFHLGFAEVDAEGVSEVLSLRPSPDLEIHTELEARGVNAVSVSELEDESLLEAGERDRRRESDRAIYRRSLAALREISTALAGPDAVEPSLGPRAVGEVVARASEDARAVLALMTLSGHGDRLPYHEAAVMLGAVAIGRAAGLDDHALLALGQAALLHDTGLALGADDASHPVTGAQALGALPDESLTAMLAAYEHHMGTDGSGFPPSEEGHRLHPYTRAMRVADRYDELTRPADGRAMRPDEAVVQILREASGGPLDPVLARLFAQQIGVFPIGGVLRLADHSVGVVTAPGEDPLRPRVLLVLAADGSELRPPVEIDLREDERAIVEVLDAALVGLEPAEYV